MVSSRERIVTTITTILSSACLFFSTRINMMYIMQGGKRLTLLAISLILDLALSPESDLHALQLHRPSIQLVEGYPNLQNRRI
jgi:hypothetical protein